MILADIQSGSDGSAWYRFFHERRWALVRYISSGGALIRTEAEAERCAALGLAHCSDAELIIR